MAAERYPRLPLRVDIRELLEYYPGGEISTPAGRIALAERHSRLPLGIDMEERWR